MYRHTHEHPNYKKDVDGVPLTCGGVAQIENGGESLRCWTCMCVVGSIACPCKNTTICKDHTNKSK